ncbi:MAG: hypothetical protein J6N76_05575, partial [Lachnospiraceae bacterium]|nr:hypothetical protein [Lachnospiraceae bacterium]
MNQNEAEKIIDFLDAHPEGYGENELKSSMDEMLIKSLSGERGNLIEWLPVIRYQRALVFGSGCGELAGELLKKEAFVDYIEQSKEAEKVLNRLYQGLPSFRLFQDAAEVFSESRSVYDWILVPEGLFNDNMYFYSLHLNREGGRSSNAEERLLGFLEELKGHLNPLGHIVFITDNLLGLKQFSAPARRMDGEYFGQLVGDYGNRGKLLFSRRELDGIFSAAGLNCRYYYPYPDEIFPEYIYSDERLPAGDELHSIRLSEQGALRLFDENGAYKTLIDAGLYREMASVFICLLEAKDGRGAGYEFPLYVKYSVRRREEYRICTEVMKDEGGSSYIRKRPYDDAASEHIMRMREIYAGLIRACDGENISPCPMETEEPAPGIPYGAVRFKLLNGESLDMILDGLWESGNTALVYQKLDELHNRFYDMAMVPFEPSERFASLFGLDIESAADHFGGERSWLVTDIDLIPANIFKDGEQWGIIDYEWSVKETVPFSFIWYRFIHYYVEVSPARKAHFGDSLYER